MTAPGTSTDDVLYEKCAGCHQFVEPNDTLPAHLCRRCHRPVLLITDTRGTGWHHEGDESLMCESRRWRASPTTEQLQAPLALPVAGWCHLHRGDTDDEALDASHEPRPSGMRATLSTWRAYGPAPMRARFGENPDPAAEQATRMIADLTPILQASAATLLTAVLQVVSARGPLANTPAEDTSAAIRTRRRRSSEPVGTEAGQAADPQCNVRDPHDARRVCRKTPHKGRHAFSLPPHQPPARRWVPIDLAYVSSGSRRYTIRPGHPVKVRGLGRGGSTGDGYTVVALEQRTDGSQINVEVRKSGRGARTRVVPLERVVYKRPKAAAATRNTTPT